MISLTLSGCSIQRSSRYYFPMVVRTYPSKPSNVRIPILEHPPKRPYLVIGRMAFETDDGINFVYRSLQYNASKNGADAVIMRLTPKRRDLMDVFVEAQMIVFR